MTRRRFFALLVIFVSAARTLSANQESKAAYPNARLLIEPADLAKDRGKFIILDARNAKDYAAGHIPGAVRVDADAWRKTFGDGDDAAAWSKRIGELGIDGKRPVAVYDSGSATDAARVWWILRYWGVPDVRLVNGFWKAWTTLGLPTNTETPVIEPAKFQARSQADRLATKDELLSLLGGKDSKVQIVDSRSFGEYCGIVAQGNKRPGHLPGAKHLDWTELLQSKENPRFKSSEELRKLFKEKGIDLDQPAIAHCQSGGRSSVMVFAFELMGNENAANYYKSFGEWGNSADTPVEK